MKVLIVKNIGREGPGLLLEVLHHHHIGYDSVDLENGENFPDPKGYSAIFVFGGPDSANDTTQKMAEELKRIKEAIDLNIPYLGLCLGMQALVKAGGGQVRKNHVKEIGFKDPEGNFFEVELTAVGKSDPLFSGLRSPLRIFHLHGETVQLAGGMELLAKGKFCENQVVKVGGNAYGIQGHIELTPKMFEEWRTQDPDLISLDQAALLRDYAAVREEYEKSGKQIIGNFLRIAKIVR